MGDNELQWEWVLGSQWVMEITMGNGNTMVGDNGGYGYGDDNGHFINYYYHCFLSILAFIVLLQ